MLGGGSGTRARIEWGGISSEDPSLQASADLSLFDFDEIGSEMNVIRDRLRRILTQVRGAISRLTNTITVQTGTNVTSAVDDLLPKLDYLAKSADSIVRQWYLTTYDGMYHDDRGVGSVGVTADTAETRAKNLMRGEAIHRLRSSDAASFKFANETTGLMYFLKVTRIFGQIAALSLAQKVFAERYVSTMYSSGGRAPSEDPPSLARMLYVFLGIDATLQMFVLLILVMLSFTWKRSDNTYLVDNDFLGMFLMEYFVSTVMIVALGLLFAQLMREKVYFQYPVQGTVVSKAYMELMIGVCVVTTLLPFHLLFS